MASPSACGCWGLVTATGTTWVPVAVRVAPWRGQAGHPQGLGPARPDASGLSPRPPAAGRDLWGYDGLAGVVCRSSLAGLPPSGRGYPVVGWRPPPEAHTGAPTSSGAAHAPQPPPSVWVRLPARAPHGPGGRLSSPGGLRTPPAHGRPPRPARTGAVSPEAPGVPAAGVGPRGHPRGACRVRRPRQPGLEPGAGLWGGVGLPPALEVYPWPGPQRPGHAPAALVV